MSSLAQRLQAFIEEGDRLLSAFDQSNVDDVMQSHQRRSVMAREIFSDKAMQQDWSAQIPLLRRIRMQDEQIVRGSKQARSRMAEAGVKLQKGRRGAQIYSQYTTSVVIEQD